MTESILLPELITLTAQRWPQAMALTSGTASLSYADLHLGVTRFAAGLRGLGVERSERVAIFLEKRFETVIASFGATAAGAVFVPINPLLKPEQVAFILRDCNVRVLVTSPERLALVHVALAGCHDLRHVVVTDPPASAAPPESHASAGVSGQVPAPWGLTGWAPLAHSGPLAGHRGI